jgi:hypothetical protein
MSLNHTGVLILLHNAACEQQPGVINLPACAAIRSAGGDSRHQIGRPTVQATTAMRC